ncbi:class II aldolase/adducin family protein [Methylocella sp. CPCC 101449]|uniref:class II aldolase/adducin family protein n=1 Tax=Methylocella sp. CPCC 101449 TaxID=2987531 RepID=UPI00288D3F2C|nr:class II aldolase/adducin family protein [Methylocella sp. CPCC 101449]MDT2022787.1 class II aldolase/adducin family protein [Methylocella sp. CPCC 101449]
MAKQHDISIDYGETRLKGISREEWVTRVQLAACYRIFAHLGWTELIYNHITLRVPGPERHFLINPFGLHYSEVQASNLIKIDLDGNKLSDSNYPVNPAGLAPHSTIHRNIETAHCVMHTHTTSGLAVACLRDGLSMTNFYSAQLNGRIAYHDFEGITVNADEGPRMLASLDGRPVMILRNHGLLAWGETLPQAFAYLWTLQRACDIQVAAQSLGPLIPIPEPVLEQCTRISLQFNPDYGAGVDVFNALVRQIDKVDQSYRQ